MFKKITVLAALAAASSVSALSVLVPNSDWWWQTGNQALFEWDCHNFTNTLNNPNSQFAVLANNPSQTLLTGGYAVIIGIQDNDVCMTNIIPNLNVGTGYFLTLTNIVNYTDIYARSEDFEIKAMGSPYPTGSTPAIPLYTTTGATAQASTTGTAPHTGGASQVALSVGGALAIVGALTSLLA